MKNRSVMHVTVLCLGLVFALGLLQGCGGGGIIETLDAPRITSVVISRFLKSASDASDWDELKLAVTVEDPNSDLTGVDGKPKPKAKQVRFCLKYDPQENAPLTAAEAAGYLANMGGATPPDIYVFQVDFTVNPQQVVIPQFNGAAFERDKRYWISALLKASNGAGGPLSPACEPQRFKMLPGLPLPPEMVIEKKLWGEVKGPDGAPLAGVEVKYVHEGTPIEADVTGADGAYEFFIYVANPRGTSALRQVSRGEVAGPTNYELRAKQLAAPGREALEYLDPEYKDYNVDFTLTAAPQAALSANPHIGRVDLAVSFDASASADPDGTIAGCDWDWNGDGVYDQLSGGATPQHVYFTPGTYNATVRVVDNAGSTDTASVSINVLDAQNDAPLAALSADPSSGDAPLPVSFDAGGSTDDWMIANYAFDFGEGGGWQDNGGTPTASHTYATPGTYTAQVRVTDNEGAQDTESVTVTVNAGWPVWQDLASLPRPRQFCDVVGYQDTIIMSSGNGIGGSAPARHLDVYLPATNTWTPDGYNMQPLQIGEFDMVVLDDKLYTIGGGSVSGPAVSDVQVLDLQTNSWTAGVSLHHPRCFAQSVVVNGKIYTFGGRASNNVGGQGPLQVEMFDPNTQTWTDISSYPVTRMPLTITAVGARIHILGEDLGSSPWTVYKTHRVFDTSDYTWSTEPDCPVFTNLNSPAGAIGNVLYYYHAADNQPARYDCTTHTWSLGTGKNPAPPGSSGGMLDGRLYIFAGTSWQTTFCAYSPQADSFH